MSHMTIGRQWAIDSAHNRPGSMTRKPVVNDYLFKNMIKYNIYIYIKQAESLCVSWITWFRQISWNSMIITQCISHSVRNGECMFHNLLKTLWLALLHLDCMIDNTLPIYIYLFYSPSNNGEQTILNISTVYNTITSSLLPAYIPIKQKLIITSLPN